jgi:S1-C subfamily serine protease
LAVRAVIQLPGLPIRVMRATVGRARIHRMSESNLSRISDQMADAVAAIASSVVQVQGHRRPASGVVCAPDVVLTTMGAVGREDGLRVRTPGDVTLDAEFAGVDPASGLAVLRARNLGVPTATVSQARVRVGHLALAVARSWSNVVTASSGIVAVIGGPLPTGRGRAIDQVLRTTAPMHEGFSGGAFADMSGHVIGIATASTIRGLGVVIPASIAWKTADGLLEHGRLQRGYLGVASQRVRLAGRQRDVDRREHGLLVAAVTPGSPADAVGILVGDVLLQFDGHPLESPETLFDLLVGPRVGRPVTMRLLRGDTAQDVTITVGERPGH